MILRKDSRKGHVWAVRVKLSVLKHLSSPQSTANLPGSSEEKAAVEEKSAAKLLLGVSKGLTGYNGTAA